jgi:hypothetical protein
MAEIADAGSIAEKWARVTPGRSEDYKRGIASPRRDWAKATAAANASWKAGVQDSIGRDAFLKGVNAAGVATWQDAALSKGVERWGPGVQGAQAKFERNFAPYVAALKALVLPTRYARRDPRNMARVNAVVDAMIKVKKAA